MEKEADTVQQAVIQIRERKEKSMNLNPLWNRQVVNLLSIKKTYHFHIIVQTAKTKDKLCDFIGKWL